MKELFEAQVPPETIPQLIEDTRKAEGVRNVEVVSTESGRLVGIPYASNCGGCALLARSDCFIAGAVARKEPAIEWNLVFRDRESLRRLVSRLERNGYAVKLLRLPSVRGSVPLTRRQGGEPRRGLRRGRFAAPH